MGNRRISVWATLQALADAVQLTLTDEDGNQATVQQPFPAGHAPCRWNRRCPTPTTH
ncbi:MAG: hypothetical protein PHH58_04270 [Rhodoferax sp.]|nr:hypothetical protein [Rhodoferax sp.]